MTLIFISFTVHLISIKPILSDHLSYVTIFHCSFGRSHDTFYCSYVNVGVLVDKSFVIGPQHVDKGTSVYLKQMWTLYSKCCSFSARYPLCIYVYMIPTTNKIIQLSPYGLQQAITILLTLNLTIYHIAQVLHFFVDESLEKKTWLSRWICQTQKNTSQESLYLNETKYVNTVLNTFTNKCCNFGANQKCQMVASWDQKLSTNNSREQNTNQESTETNQQQPTDITQKITNAHAQHELPMNLKWTQVVPEEQAIPAYCNTSICVSIIKSGRTLIRWRAKDLKQPQIFCHLGAVNQLMMSAVEFFLNLIRVLGSPMWYNHWKNPK